jgi:hypothetical protein
MVANLSHPKRGFEDRREALERLAVRARSSRTRLLAAVDADTAAFDAYLAAPCGCRRAHRRRQPPAHRAVMIGDRSARSRSP